MILVLEIVVDIIIGRAIPNRVIPIIAILSRAIGRVILLVIIINYILIRIIAFRYYNIKYKLFI